MLVALIVACCLQDTETVSRTHREGYGGAVGDYDHALFLTERDPKQALQVIERVFERKIDKRDRRLVFERPNGQLAKPVDFFPYQARGRIRLVLAKAEPENAAALLAGAAADLKVSSDAGVKSSEDLLRAVRGAQERLKNVKPPEPPKESAAERFFLDSWRKLMDDHRFRAARDLLESRSDPLGAEKKRECLRETEDRSRKYVAAALDDFLKAIELNLRPPLLRQVKPAEFSRLFALPSDAEAVGAYPELDWARQERLILDKLRLSDPHSNESTSASLLESLIAQMLATEAFEKSGENRWFRVSGQFTYRYVEDLLVNLAAMSKEAGPELRGKLRAQAEGYRAKWSEALAKIPRDFLQANQVHENSRRLASLLDEFPVDSAEIDKTDLEACFLSESPDTALENVISSLTKVRDQQGARLPKESLRKLLTELVAASALHEFLAGKSVEEVGKGLQELGRTLSHAGGPSDPDRWGPKVQKVFAALK
jgi:hypothetical protein